MRAHLAVVIEIEVIEHVARSEVTVLGDGDRAAAIAVARLDLVGEAVQTLAVLRVRMRLARVQDQHLGPVLPALRERLEPRQLHPRRWARERCEHEDDRAARRRAREGDALPRRRGQLEGRRRLADGRRDRVERQEPVGLGFRFAGSGLSGCGLGAAGFEQPAVTAIRNNARVAIAPILRRALPASGQPAVFVPRPRWRVRSHHLDVHEARDRRTRHDVTSLRQRSDRGPRTRAPERPRTACTSARQPAPVSRGDAAGVTTTGSGTRCPASRAGCSIRPYR